MILCKVCGKEFQENKRWHHSTGICGDECRIIQRRISKIRYKETEKGKITTKKWQQSEKFKNNEKIYRAKPKAKHLAVLRTLKYQKNNPEKRKWWDKCYGHLKRNYIAGPIDKMAWFKKCKALNYECQICFKQLIPDLVTIDHIIPLSKGGKNNIENLQPLCRSCNSAKKDRILTNV